MSITLLLDMAVAGDPEREIVSAAEGRMTLADFAGAVAAAGDLFRRSGAEAVAYLGINSLAFPVTVFAAAHAGIPVCPLNYRLEKRQVASQVASLPNAMVVATPDLVGVVEEVDVITSAELLAAKAENESCSADVDDEQPAVLLFTSGTTAAPKTVVLRHSHLLAYVLQTVDFGSAAAADAALICVPPYHIAGAGTVLSNLYAGRRMVYLSNFAACDWLETARSERVTSAMVVPTMLAQIVDQMERDSTDLPSLRSIAYGGAKAARSVVERALNAFPSVDFANAYGLTETSSTIAILGPEEHRAAIASSDPAIRERLGSAGRLVPGVEAEIRDDEGRVLGTGERGELWVKGPQVSGEYLGRASVLDDAGWFPTRDVASFDEDGYLFLEGRADDTIIRGGENLSPAEIEATLIDHPAVRDVAVVGVPDEVWGQRIAAVIVSRTDHNTMETELLEWCRARLRSSKTPQQFVFWRELPYSHTGKLLRREIVAQLAGDQ